MADQFVAAVALVLGSTALAAACSPTSWPLRWNVARRVQLVAGTAGLRIFFIVSGLAMLAIGVSLLL
ncbi:MAG: hypothetical protein U0892_06445 [Pirellulales bacterium]